VNSEVWKKKFYKTQPPKHKVKNSFLANIKIKADWRKIHPNQTKATKLEQ